jgi:iron complex outermembrane receptor protein
MDYDNQLVLTGQINDVGGYTRTNVKDSYRAGIELEGGYKILDNLGITGNLTLSQNKIVEFTEYMDAYDVNFDYLGQVETVHQNTDLAFSPNIIAGLTLNYEPIKNLRLNWMFKHVGAQFLDNTSNTSRMLDSYFISHLNIAYIIKDKFFKETTIGLRVNNLFNEQFENNGYTWGYIYDNNRVDENFYYPQAGTHFLLRLTVKF